MWQYMHVWDKLMVVICNVILSYLVIIALLYVYGWWDCWFHNPLIILRASFVADLNFKFTAFYMQSASTVNKY